MPLLIITLEGLMGRERTILTSVALRGAQSFPQLVNINAGRLSDLPKSITKVLFSPSETRDPTHSLTLKGEKYSPKHEAFC